MLVPVSSRRSALDERHSPWRPQLLHEVLDSAARLTPERQFVVAEGTTLTYEDVRERSLALARGLIDAGVRPRENVALLMANFPDFVPMKYAISRVGATCVPINFLNRKAELGYVLSQSDSVVLITMDQFRGLDYQSSLDELMPGWESTGGGENFPKLRSVFVFPTGQGVVRPHATSMEALSERGQDLSVPERAVEPDAPSDIIYTSGTTGNPKGVLLTHDRLVRTSYGAAFSRAFEDGRRITFSLPMYHVYGYVEGMLAVPWVSGAIIPQVTFDARSTLSAIGDYGATDILLVPTMTIGLLDVLKTGETFDLSPLTAMISSGGYSPPSLWDDIATLFGPVELTTGYGMSETTATTTLTEPDVDLSKHRSTNGHMRPCGIAGDPALGGALTQYKVVDQESGDILGPGEVGELCARGPGITSGYYNKHQETQDAFDADGWFKSGDLGFFDSDGFMSLVGRSKDLYRCGGEQVVPLEIENVLLTHPAVHQAHVVPLRHDKMGEVGVACIVLRPDKVVSEEDLRSLCSEKLAKFKVPAHVLFFDASEIPVTASGRPRKFLLAQVAAEALRPTQP